MKALITLLASLLLALPLTAAEPEGRMDRVRKLVEIVGGTAAQEAVIDELLAQATEAAMADLSAWQPETPEEHAELAAQRAEIERNLARYREILLEKLDLAGFAENHVVPLYARFFSDDEVKQLLAFYETPVGKKLIRTQPEITRASMQAGAEVLGPAFAAAGAQLEKERERERPWIPTMASIRSLATAMEAYATDHNVYPRASTLDELEAAISPTYIRTVPRTDGWENELAVIVSPDGMSYRIASAGADGIFEWDSRTVGPPAVESDFDFTVVDDPGADILYENGSFLRIPRQAQENPGW